MYHTHSGVGLVGAPIWDLHIMMKDIDPKLVGINYDIGHATSRAGSAAGSRAPGIAGAHVRGIALKDFVWAKDERGRWREQWCPIGEGMVHFAEFFGMVAAIRLQRPGAGALRVSAAEGTAGEYAAMKRDLTTIRGYMAKAGL